MNFLIEYALYAYLAIGIANSMLAMADVHAPTGTVHRLNGRPVWLLMLGLVVGPMITYLLIWPRALAGEGRRVFMTYLRFGVIRQIVDAYREADSYPSEKLT